VADNSVATVVFFDGCPHWATVDRRLRALADELGFTLRYCRVDSPEQAQRLAFRGSPTVLVDGRDPFAAGDEPVGLSCRVYRTSHGVRGAPEMAQLRQILE
jgi:hypothetical protein